MPTAKKAAVIDDLTDKLGRINAAALIEYRGLTVAEIGELRTQLRPRDIEIAVTKNTLLRAAAHRNNMTDLDDLFTGPNAVAFIYGDEAAGTKALNDYFRTARVGEIKSGILKGGRRVSAEQFAKLADLPNRQTLLAQIAGLLESPLSQLASLFNAPAQQLAYALAAFEDKGGAAGTGVHGAPPATSASDTAPEAVTTPAPQATATATTTDAGAPDATMPVTPVIESAAPSAPPVEDTVVVAGVAPAAPIASIATPLAVESDVTGPADAVDAMDAMAGEDMSEPPIAPDVTPSRGDMPDTAPVTPEDAEDGTVDQIASPVAAETRDTATGQQAAATVAVPQATTSDPIAAQPLDVTVETAPTVTTAVTPAVTEEITTAAPVRITSSDASIPTVVDASSQESERAVDDVSRAPESEGSATTAPAQASEKARPTLRFSASLPADTHETVSGQEAASDPTSAPESEGSAS